MGWDNFIIVVISFSRLEVDDLGWLLQHDFSCWLILSLSISIYTYFIIINLSLYIIVYMNLSASSKSTYINLHQFISTCIDLYPLVSTYINLYPYFTPRAGGCQGFSLPLPLAKGAGVGTSWDLWRRRGPCCLRVECIRRNTYRYHGYVQISSIFMTSSL